ncbi:hypothetical protein [Desulfosarcina cetonica]|uniref:hypothetical protein n=1 Tax=Desulfosarcina cetonica TaxID=90730 RepID=UPI00248BD26D|nr:hypothetical protein [Desulfosarcina cetonica]
MSDTCRTETECREQARDKLSAVAERIIDHCQNSPCYTHIDSEPIPAEGFVADIIDMFRELLFPGYFSREKLDPVNLRYSLGQTVSKLYDLLADLITHNIRHDCLRYNQSCSDCTSQGHSIALAVMDTIPEIRQVLASDVRAASRATRRPKATTRSFSATRESMPSASTGLPTSCTIWGCPCCRAS